MKVGLSGGRTSWVLASRRRSCLVLAVGAIALIAQHPLHDGGLIEYGIVAAVGVFVVLELVGILSHVSHITMSLETRLKRRIRDWLDGA